MNFTLPWTASNGHANGATEKLDDVRNALSKEVDHLAQVASQMGRDAGAHAEGVAHDVARDAQKQTNVAVDRIAAIAATLGPTIATIGRQKMRQASEQAQNIGQELRHVRLTTEPKRSDTLTTAGLIVGISAGIGAGAALAYLLDPISGKGRREQLKARLSRWLNDGRAVAAEKANALRETVTNGIGVPDEPLIAEELEYETTTWPEGERVPTMN